VSRERDVNDLDHDNDTEEMIRWRYVVLIDDCEIFDDKCLERHRLVKCWKDEAHSCDAVSTVIGPFWAIGAVGECACTNVDQSTYPGCDVTNYHYIKRCVPVFKTPGLSQLGRFILPIVMVLLAATFLMWRKLSGKITPVG